MKPTVIIACGALAREITTLIELNDWRHFKLQCLPARFHNTPTDIAPAVKEKIRQCRAQGYERLFVAYADCGTGGLLDKVLEEEGVERLPGPHCYSFFAGAEVFDKLQHDTLGTFYLTDFLARHFDRLILRDMGIEKHPELLPMYFGHYTKLVYLSQVADSELIEKAQQAAARLRLTFEHQVTGYGDLKVSLDQLTAKLPTHNEKV